MLKFFQQIRLELHKSFKFVKSCGSPKSLTLCVVPMMFGSSGWLSTIWLWIWGAVASTLMMISGDLKSSRLPSILNMNVWFHLNVTLSLWRSCYGNEYLFHFQWMVCFVLAKICLIFCKTCAASEILDWYPPGSIAKPQRLEMGQYSGPPTLHLVHITV